MENETTSLSQSKIMQILDWAYEKAVNGVAGLESAEDLANDYLKKEGNLHDKVNALIRWQNTKAGTSGFVTGLGGVLVLPVTLPVNITSVLYVQIRMIAAIAKMGGHDLKDDKVKSLVYVCLVANSLKGIMKDIGIQIGEKVALTAIKKIPGSLLIKINRAVGFKLLTKFGEKGIINIAKGLPLVGGIIGGTFDVVTTDLIGNRARNLFIGEQNMRL